MDITVICSWIPLYSWKTFHTYTQSLRNLNRKVNFLHIENIELHGKSDENQKNIKYRHSDWEKSLRHIYERRKYMSRPPFPTSNDIVPNIIRNYLLFHVPKQNTKMQYVEKYCCALLKDALEEGTLNTKWSIQYMRNLAT